MVDWNIFKDNEIFWNEQLLKMPFCTLYQSYQWGEIKKKDGWEVIRLIGKKENNSVVSMGQFLYKRLPMNIVFLWCPGGILGDYQNFDFEILKSELKCFLYYCRVSFHDPKITKEELLEQNWNESKFMIGGQKSMLLDLSIGLDKLSSNLSSNWRHNVKRFEKKNLIVEHWTNPETDLIYKYYLEFESFKGLSKQHTKDSIRGILEFFKDNLIIYRSLDQENNLLALRGYIYLGNQCLDWFAISTEKGRATYASYGTCWQIIQDATRRGIKYYDFSGVDPLNNVGVYNFKKGTGAELVSFPGEFEKSSFFILNYLFNFLIKRKF